ncbi:MAG: hypothetical protein J5846_10155 [Desulfovibrio sp.]|nr:hypothetical protein [Desulfovibrio sp.]
MFSKNEQDELNKWDQLLLAAAHLQEIVKGAVLVGGTASAIYAAHRISCDADHILYNLRDEFDKILLQLESLEEWKTEKIKKPVLILGRLDGVETGIRQLIRHEPLETVKISIRDKEIVIPTQEEILRIKGALILSRNATRDYLDFVALSDVLGDHQTIKALEAFDRLYPQKNNASALVQLAIQLLRAQPQDIQKIDLANFKEVNEKWQSKDTLIFHCKKIASLLFINYVDKNADMPPKNKDDYINEYNNLFKKYNTAKYIQMRSILLKVHNSKKVQEKKLYLSLSQKPNFITSFFVGKKWHNQLTKIKGKISQIEERLTKIKYYLSNKKELEVLAEKKMRFENPQLAEKRDQQVQREAKMMLYMQNEAKKIQKELEERKKQNGLRD